MTTLGCKIKRQLPRPIDRRDWVIELDPIGIAFRRKGSPRRFLIGWDSVWNRAMEIAAEQLRKERAAARKARRSR